MLDQHKNPSITIADFIEKAPADLQLETIVSGNFLSEKRITSARIQKLGLALAGFAHYIHEGRVQIVGQSEISYLRQLPKEDRIKAIQNLDLEKISCILITKKLDPPEEFLSITKQAKVPVLRTPKVSSLAIGLVSDFLQKELAPQMTIHAVLLGMYGLGVLIKGKSGIGKSECALDLIARGHQLISDDTVIIKRIGDTLEGSATELTYEHLEIRGLGIINIRDLFGVSAVSKQKNIDLCIELKDWQEVEEIERLGLEAQEERFFGVPVPKFLLPVSPGRNLSTLVETAVKIHLLKSKGYNAAENLIKKHSESLASPKKT
ncbi:MAG: HPr(Ser) kinase/phosphatase [Acidobacteria bacterium]|jgi:HPr kinase/phosphorylase|nr:MAG: HPr(Ser) kinase/phosphatase [Acidobacteriota bacterium]GIU81041.1 MAG: HPr kinase/phosphorylase [Pyrinomonadaceae bacterium]